MPSDLVLVTGGSGFLGIHCVIAALDAGYRVRTTVRSLSREADVRAMLAVAGVDAGDRLSFAAADLLDDAGWAAAVDGCRYVLHVASPFPLTQPKDENELIVPARDGALRVLKAARDAKVKRVVLTSSFAAVGYGVPKRTAPFTEEDWTDPYGPGVSAYVKSKTLAERAAWEFVGDHDGHSLLSVVNPVGIFGPALGPELSSSVELVRTLMSGKLPGIPKVYAGVVDVRDVADLHLRAMTDQAAAGQRFLAVAGDPVGMPELGRIIRDRIGAAAAGVPTRVLPDGLVRFGGLFSRQMREVSGLLGTPRRASNEKARTMLGWTPRSSEDAVIASAESLVALGLVGSGSVGSAPDRAAK